MVLGYIRGCRRVVNWSNRQETLGPGVSNAQKPVSTLFSSSLQEKLPPPCNFMAFAEVARKCASASFGSSARRASRTPMISLSRGQAVEL